MIRRMSLVFCGAAIGFSVLVGNVQAGLWEGMPTLPSSERIKFEEALINNSPVQVSVYSTDMSLEEAVNFYKDKLSSFGWLLVSGVARDGVNAIAFSKNDKLLNISLRSIQGKNYVTITQSMVPEEMLTEKERCSDCEQKSPDMLKGQPQQPQNTGISDGASILEDNPGKDLALVPRYKGAVRANSIERDKGRKVTLTYFTKDPVEKVVDFYRQNMASYYWALENEVDLQKLPKPIAEQVGLSIKGESLVFKSSSASCIINISEEPQGKGTVIGVSYNEK